MNETALITGVISGIGKELALIHSEKGVDLVIITRSLDKIKEAIENKHNKCVYVIQKGLSLPNVTK